MKRHGSGAWLAAAAVMTILVPTLLLLWLAICFVGYVVVSWKKL